jgi:hypothetical protein
VTVWRLAPFLTGLRTFSTVTWLGCDLRIGHFFSLRCPLVNIPQLNTQPNSAELLNCLLNYLPTESLRKNDERRINLWMSSQSHVTTDGQSASLSWNKAPIWDLRPDSYYWQTVAGLLMWGVLSDERTGLSFTVAPGPCQRRHFRGQTPMWLVTIIYCLRFETSFPFRRLLRLAGLRSNAFLSSRPLIDL